MEEGEAALGRKPFPLQSSCLLLLYVLKTAKCNPGLCKKKKKRRHFFQLILVFIHRVPARFNYQRIAFLLINSAEGLAATIGRVLIIYYSFC